jgi:hypothetical protein
MPLIEDEPPQPRPLGHQSLRPSRFGSGSVQKPQLNGFWVGISTPTPAGMVTIIDLSLPPASTSRTFVWPSSVSRLASTQPAEPAPMMM